MNELPFLISQSRRIFLSLLLGAPAFLKATQPRITNLTAEHAVNNPYGVRVGPDGALYICEIGNHRISKLNLRSRVLTNVIDGQKEPYDLRFDQAGVLYFNDMPAHQVRSLDLKSGKITVIAGTGEPGFAGDGGPAAQAQLKQPHSIAFDSKGRLLICDIGNHRIRMVEHGTISTFAGTGEKNVPTDGAPRVGTALNGPRALDFDREGNVYLVLREGNCVLRLDATTDSYRRIAGTGEKGYSGDGGDARLAKLSGPKAICCAPGGNVYIADTESHTIRRIDQKGIISTIAGTGVRGDGPTGDPRGCALSRPHGVFVDGKGDVYIADSESNRIRLISFS